MAQPATPARRTLYNDPTFSDIKIRQIYNGQVKEYAAHKAMLCAQSGWFMTALTGRFKEASASTIEVHEDDPETFQAMMEFFYSNSTKIKSKSMVTGHTTNGVKSVLVPIIHLHALAGKYDTAALQEATAVTFREVTKNCVVVLSIGDVELLIHAHYPLCASVMDDMSQAIVIFILSRQPAIMRDEAINKLVRQYGNFGGDLFILGKAIGSLTVR